MGIGGGILLLAVIAACLWCFCVHSKAKKAAVEAEDANIVVQPGADIDPSGDEGDVEIVVQPPAGCGPAQVAPTDRLFWMRLLGLF